MGAEMMANLAAQNIIRDSGAVGRGEVESIASQLAVRLPEPYVDFIVRHNGARLLARIFNYTNTHLQRGATSDAMFFLKFEDVLPTIKLLTCDEDPDLENFFEDGLIPFGDTGGGDKICFDYRNDRKTDDPPIVLWKHEIGFKDGVLFIADNFEEFVNMLHEPEDE